MNVSTIALFRSLLFFFSLSALLARVFISASYFRTVLTRYLVSEAQIHILALNPNFIGFLYASDITQVYLFAISLENVTAAMIVICSSLSAWPAPSSENKLDKRTDCLSLCSFGMRQFLDNPRRRASGFDGGRKNDSRLVQVNQQGLDSPLPYCIPFPIEKSQSCSRPFAQRSSAVVCLLMVKDTRRYIPVG